MTGKQGKRPRPGGRTARTKERTFEAIASLVAEKGAATISMAEIAQRAGVAATSLYRRWGNVEALIMNVAVEQLQRELQLPDTGTLDGDLRSFARSIAAELAKPEGSAFFRTLIATADAAANNPPRRAALQKRLDEITAMLERATTRGERAPHIDDVVDVLLAPLYTRTLAGMPIDDRLIDVLVDRLLTS